MNLKLTITSLAAIVLLFAAENNARAQVTLSVTPSVTSNAYTGFITLNINGLTNGEQVVIQKYLDSNTNGVVDPGELLVDTFKLQDGGAMVIGGITNVSVPYDSNPASGAITATLNFVPAITLENMTGNFVYQVISPTGRFSPATATFVVTNAALGQSISGTVYNNGTPVPYAMVVAQDQEANNPTGAVLTDANGNYHLTLPPSTYTLLAGAANCYYDFSTAPSFTLGAGQSVTTNLFITSGGPTTISGTIYDSGKSNGIGAVLLTLSSGSLFSFTFTDTNGNYSAALTPSFWKIQPAKERLARRAYLVSDSDLQVDATAGSVTNANIGLPRGNALFYGSIKNSSNAPFPNTELDGGSLDSGYSCKGFSDANGNYGVAVLGDSNQWNCAVNSGKNTPLANYVMNSFPTVGTFPNETLLQNFVPLPAVGQISGRVLDNSGNPVSGVTLTGSANINGGNYQTLDATTDNSGYYSMAVADGQWSLQFLTGGFSDNLDTHGYEDISSPHFVSIPPTNAILNLTVYPLGTPYISLPQRMSSSQFGFTLNGATNVSYSIQVSTNLASTNWTTVYSLTLTNTAVLLVDPNATNSPRFYRVKKN